MNVLILDHPIARVVIEHSGEGIGRVSEQERSLADVSVANKDALDMLHSATNLIPCQFRIIRRLEISKLERYHCCNV
jgi:hypothetical protein